MAGALTVVWLAPVSLTASSITGLAQVRTVYGSLRHGQADLAGGYVVTWRTRPALRPWPGLAGTVALAGDDTRLGGSLALFPDRLGLSALSGRAGPGLAGLVPGAWRCDASVRVDGVALAWRLRRVTAGGGASLPATTCAKGEARIDLPPLDLALTTEDRAGVARLSGGGTPLATATLRRERRVDIDIRPEASRVFPALPAGGPLALSVPF